MTRFELREDHNFKGALYEATALAEAPVSLEGDVGFDPGDCRFFGGHVRFRADDLRSGRFDRGLGGCHLRLGGLDCSRGAARSGLVVIELLQRSRAFC